MNQALKIILIVGGLLLVPYILFSLNVVMIETNATQITEILAIIGSILVIPSFGIQLATLIYHFLEDRSLYWSLKYIMNQ